MYDDRYWSKILGSTISTSLHDLKVKVTDLEFLCLSFALKFLGPHYFQTIGWICSYDSMMIDIGLKVLGSTILTPLCGLKVKVMDLGFLCLSFA